MGEHRGRCVKGEAAEVCTCILQRADWGCFRIGAELSPVAVRQQVGCYLHGRYDAGNNGCRRIFSCGIFYISPFPAHGKQ